MSGGITQNKPSPNDLMNLCALSGAPARTTPSNGLLPATLSYGASVVILCCNKSTPVACKLVHLWCAHWLMRKRRYPQRGGDVSDDARASRGGQADCAGRMPQTQFLPPSEYTRGTVF